MVVRSVIDNSHEDTICLFFSSNRRQRRDIVLGEEDSRAASAVLQGERHKREREETPPADCQTLRIKGSSRWLPLSLFLSACLDDEMPETETPLASYGSLKKIDLNHGQDNKSALLRGNAGEKNEGRSDTKEQRWGERYRRGVVYKGCPISIDGQIDRYQLRVVTSLPRHAMRLW